jgi:hypothetical protein
MAFASFRAQSPCAFWGRRTEIEIPGYWTGPGW